MVEAAKNTLVIDAAVRGRRCRTSDSDVLEFLMRTLKAHCRDGDSHDIVAKLRSLKSALDQQEIMLSDWPDSPSKDRICEALVRARTFVVQLVDESRSQTQ